jgi:Sel1 repeat
MKTNRLICALLLFFGTALFSLAAQQFKPDQKPIEEIKAKAEAGDANSQCELGIRYGKGEGVAKDPVEAAKWFREAAEQNLARGQYDLGNCYFDGEGVAKDLVEAYKWYRKAAEQNYAWGQYSLGFCYAKGEGVAKDLVEAAKWCRKAAEQNLADAQLNLGFCYANGEGVAKDLVEAYKWELLATGQGNEDAKKIITFLESEMTPEQMADGQKLARNFSPGTTTTDKPPVTTDSRTKRIRALAAESNAALISGNYARVADFPYAKVIEMMGGRDKMIETTRQTVEDMKDHGVTIIGIEVSEPERVVAAKDKLFAVVPQVVRMVGPKKTARATGFLIAVSEDAGKNWSFIDGAGLQDRESLAQLIPDFPAELSLPKKEPPVFEPK